MHLSVPAVVLEIGYFTLWKLSLHVPMVAVPVLKFILVTHQWPSWNPTYWDRYCPSEECSIPQAFCPESSFSRCHTPHHQTTSSTRTLLHQHGNTTSNMQFSVLSFFCVLRHHKCRIRNVSCIQLIMSSMYYTHVCVRVYILSTYLNCDNTKLIF